MIAFEQLEYNKIKTILAEECHSSLGAELAMAIEPLTDKIKIEDKLQLAGEIKLLTKNKTRFNFSRISNLALLFTENIHQVFNFEEFQRINFNLVAANSVNAVLRDVEDYPLFQKISARMIRLEFLEKRFDEIFSPEGDVLDSASNALRGLRRRRRALRQNVVSEMNKTLDKFEAQSYLHDKIVTQRDGRYVIPIKNSASGLVNGIVHGSSGSKSSVFVEPAAVVGMNNEIEMVSDEERQEIFRIFTEFTAQMREYHTEILNNTNLLKLLDYNFAVARFANRVQATIPEVVDEPILELKQARHPLLIENLGSVKKVIPFDLQLGKDYRLLVISGPNTGGKTVTLKSVGLLTMMALSGLPIPVAGDSVVGIFNRFYADIGDQQSIENALSTFSSHIKNIEDMVNVGDSRTLVLIDEIGAATDPEQGSALAQAVLEKLYENEVAGVITTHYTALKVFAEQTEGCINAAMQFDPEMHIPTYNFKLGLPGNSFAIEVASKLGLDEDLINRAKELTGKQSIELTELLQKMTKEKIELSRQSYQFKLKNSLLEMKIKEHEKKIQDLEKDRKEIKKKSMQEAKYYLGHLQKELNNEIENIKKQDKKDRKALLEKSMTRVNEIGRSLTNKEEALSDTARNKILDPKIGMRVWIKDIDAEGDIVSITQDRIKVDLDGMFFTTHRDKLYSVSAKVKAQRKVSGSVTPDADKVNFELKIMGHTFDSALPLIETFLDSAILAGLRTVRIVHGKGTGALRNKVRSFLRDRKFVVDFFTPAPEAGGDGVTIVKLDD